MTFPALNVLSLISSIVGAIGVFAWRVRETRTPVTPKKIIIPPLGMATGFCMFFVSMFRVPWTWAGLAFLLGALVLAYPLLKTSKLVRDGDTVWMQRSNAFFAVIIVLAGIRLAVHEYVDTIISVQQTAGIFFILAFGMILRWRADMYLRYQKLIKQ